MNAINHREGVALNETPIATFTMSTEIAVTHTMQRLLSISWEFDDSRLHEYMLLVKEYLRRSALWANVLEVTELWPFFDVSQHLVPSLRAPPEMVNVLNEHLTSLELPSPVKWTCVWHLRWAMIHDRPATRAYNLPAPYEPLIVMYEQGGRITREAGFVNISVAGVVAMDWHAYHVTSPFVAIDGV